MKSGGLLFAERGTDTPAAEQILEECPALKMWDWSFSKPPTSESMSVYL